MVEQGKSHKFCTIFALILDKYDHALVWLCMRKKRNKEYDLLKPPYRFYNFLNTVGIFILWTTISFLIALLYTSMGAMNVGLYLLALILAGLISSPLTMLVI